ncbi:hypothetical protein L916_10137, partial [Phytophthora nicotianae]
IRYDEAVSKFQDRISTLEAQLAAASSFGVIVPPDTPRRIADLESQLARSQSDLQVARDRQSALASRLRELATSHRAAQAEVARLEAAIKHKNGRLRTLNDNYERRLRKASQRVQAVTSQRDQAKAAHIVTQDRVSAARDNIARLEKRISQVEKSQKTRQDLESALATLQQEKDALAVKRDELLGQLGERFVEVRLNGTRRRRDCPTLRPFSLLRRATSEHALGPSLPPALLVSPRSLDRLQRSPRLALRVRLVRPDPRSKFCLPWQTARGSDSSSSPAGPPAPEAGAPSDDGESSSGESSSTRVFDSDAAGSVSTSPELNRAKNEFGMPSGPLSDTELAALQPTTVLRSEWIPGYRDHRSFRGHDIVPWSAQDIRQISIVEMDADLLFHR